MSDQQTSFGRAFIQLNGASPGNAYSYQGAMRVGGFTEPLGDVTPIKEPSPDVYDEFVTVGQVKGEAGLPTSSVVARLHPKATLLRIRCPFDLTIHYGECSVPSDYTSWSQVITLEQARLTSRSGETLTGLEEGDRAQILVTGEITGSYIWYIDAMGIAEVASTEVANEIVDVMVDPRVLCGDCGTESDGSTILYAISTSPQATSPGLPAELLVSKDGGATWEEHIIDTLAVDEAPTAMTLVGQHVVVISNDSGSLHYCSVDDYDAWTEVSTGFAAGGEPNAIFSLNSTATWIVGDGGYVYFTEDPVSGVEVQSSGGCTTENLLGVHAVDSNYIVACGENGTVIYSMNGGTTWAEVTGSGLPASNIRCVWAQKQHAWIVGTAGGQLYYTKNYGATWTEKAFSGSGAGTVYDIKFVHHPSCPIGFMAHTPASGRGRILRTLDGGNRWHTIPEAAGSIPDNERITCLAVSVLANFVFAGGLGSGGTDGILLVGS